MIHIADISRRIYCFIACSFHCSLISFTVLIADYKYLEHDVTSVEGNDERGKISFVILAKKFEINNKINWLMMHFSSVQLCEE